MSESITDWRAHFEQVYAGGAERYDRLVGYEDAHGVLASRIKRFADGRTNLVDIGAGTGRVTVPLCTAGKHVHAVDASPAMLRIAESRLRACAGQWTVSVADVRNLPVATDWADGAIAGWVYGHLTEWHPGSWEPELTAALAEMRRVVRPGGMEVVVDTLGTAVATPSAPSPALAEYHAYLEATGFQRKVLRTDYLFPSVEVAADLLGWFFDLGDWARQHNSPLVPEHTGWWERRTPPTASAP